MTIFTSALALLLACAPSSASHHDTWPAQLNPGAPPRSQELTAALARAWAQRPDQYVPRTRHLEADGSPTYTNRLFLETSPYLRQHAHNPVDWHPWGEEALALAASLDRPILLSVGYSTCHWCHVMEEESFEDVEIATVINSRYVAIKVDREQRPDVDATYMAAVRAMTGGGGWPMTVWLTPEGQPYYADTYIPARDGDRGARVGLLTLLDKLADAYATDHDGVVKAAQRATAQIKRELAATTRGAAADASALAQAADYYRGAYDTVNGGLRGRHKFPSSLPIRFLLSEHARTGDADLLDMATHTLDRMDAGGIHDPLGGGFHRYATDPAWRVPHFEKMLYDNAQLASTYTAAWRVTGEERYREVAESTLDYVAREMTSDAGLFWSATDADSPGPDGEREEGRFFTWTPDDVRALLPAADAPVALAWFDITPEGDVDGRTVLTRPLDPPAMADRLGMSLESLEASVERSRVAMLAARDERPRPGLDDKVLTSWNGLMISAFAQAGRAMERPDYTARAAKAADLLLSGERVDGGLPRVRGGKLPAMLEDYSFLIAGLLDLFEATGEARWLAQAVTLTDEVETRYADPAGGWFRTPADHAVPVARPRPGGDGAEPSGASVQVRNLLRLEALTADARYRKLADAAFQSVGAILSQHPSAMPELLLALDWATDRPREIVIVGPQREAMLAAVSEHAPRNHVLIAITEEQIPEVAAVAPIVAGKLARDGQTTAYVCEEGRCELPTTDPEELGRMLDDAR